MAPETQVGHVLTGREIYRKLEVDNHSFLLYSTSQSLEECTIASHYSFEKFKHRRT